jgi:hypothetical protein
MSRMQLPPNGIRVYFLADASIQGYPPREIDHPLTGSRIQAVAATFSDLAMRSALNSIGHDLDDAAVRESIAVTAKTTDESTLAPRTSHLQLKRGTAAGGTAGSLPFQGRYLGQFVQNIDPDPLQMEMILARQGNSVTGQFSFGLGNATITTGTVSGTDLRVTWQWAGRYGQGILKATSNSEGFTGTWGFGNATSGAGTWSGTRR